MSKELINSIVDGDLVSATEMFSEQIDLIREKKLFEVKRSIDLTELWGYGRDREVTRGPMVGKSNDERRKMWKQLVKDRKDMKAVAASNDGQGGRISKTGIEKRRDAGYLKAHEYLNATKFIDKVKEHLKKKNATEQPKTTRKRKIAESAVQDFRDRAKEFKASEKEIKALSGEKPEVKAPKTKAEPEAKPAKASKAPRARKAKPDSVPDNRTSSQKFAADYMKASEKMRANKVASDDEKKAAYKARIDKVKAKDPDRAAKMQGDYKKAAFRDNIRKDYGKVKSAVSNTLSVARGTPNKGAGIGSRIVGNLLRALEEQNGGNINNIKVIRK